MINSEEYAMGRSSCYQICTKHERKILMTARQLFPVAATGGLIRDRVKAVKTGEYRRPKKGEYYLSGAIVEAWRASNDLKTPYWIARLIRVKTRVVHDIEAYVLTDHQNIVLRDLRVRQLPGYSQAIARMWKRGREYYIGDKRTLFKGLIRAIEKGNKQAREVQSL